MVRCFFMYFHCSLGDGQLRCVPLLDKASSFARTQKKTEQASNIFFAIKYVYFVNINNLPTLVNK